MPQNITITNIVKLSQNNFEVHFESDYTLTQLSAQYSVDGSSWSNPIALDNTTSPKVLNININSPFYVRIYDNAPDLIRKHNSKFNPKFN